MAARSPSGLGMAETGTGERRRAAARAFTGARRANPGGVASFRRGYAGVSRNLRACRSRAGAAMAVAREALKGNPAFSLMRPPGHHAMGDRAMGFCYFSHIAIAALDALENGAERVAIWDFDAHHGNGTEDIVAGNPRIAFASIHQLPGYPGTGTRSFGNVHNFPS